MEYYILYIAWGNGIVHLENINEYVGSLNLEVEGDAYET